MKTNKLIPLAAAVFNGLHPKSKSLAINQIFNSPQTAVKPTMFIKQKYLVSLFSTAAACLTLASSASAATIVYDFTGNSAAVTTNDLSGDGVTAGNIATVANSGQAGVAENRWQRKLTDSNTDTMSFTVTIPADVIVNFSELSFIDGIDSGTGSNNTFSQWDLSISIGSGSPNSGTEFVAGTGFSQSANTVTLSGLTGLSGTDVTFTWAVNYGVTSDFSGSGNNNVRHAFLDDVTLTGSVIPEPTTALLGSLGMLALLRRRR